MNMFTFAIGDIVIITEDIKTSGLWPEGVLVVPADTIGIIDELLYDSETGDSAYEIAIMTETIQDTTCVPAHLVRSAR